MDWPLAVDRNRENLLRIILALVASLGLSDGGVLKTLPRFLYRRAMRILVPAESALRRLIVMAVYEMLLRGVKFSASARGRTSFTNFILLNPSSENQIPAFNLIDPRKVFDLEAPDYSEFGHAYEDDDIYAEHRDPANTIPIAAASLGRRLLALKAALENLPKQARRLARWYEQRDLARQQNQPHLFSPIRPGLPVGYRKHRREEIDEVMLDCHSLARMAIDRVDSS